LEAENSDPSLPPPSLSFGVAVHYYKYPLYESFDLAYNLLYKAKYGENSAKKNALAFSLQKHSGQSLGIIFPNYETGKDGKASNPCFEKFCTLLDQMNETKVNEEDFLKSVETHLRQFERLFANAIKISNRQTEENRLPMIDNLFHNTFDSNIHRDMDNPDQVKGQLKDLKELLKLCVPGNCFVDDLTDTTRIDSEYKDEIRQLHTMDALLRLLKFYQERGKEEQDA
jgi:hypothetical protein